MVYQHNNVLEFGVPVWNSGLTVEETSDIERVQKSFLHIVLGHMYLDYESALIRTDLETLQSRRKALCLKFARKASKHGKHKH